MPASEPGLVAGTHDRCAEVRQGRSAPSRAVHHADTNRSIRGISPVELSHSSVTIKQRLKLAEKEAARISGMPAADLREILQGHFGEVDVSKLVDCLRRLGHDIEIIVKPLPTDPSKHGSLVVTPPLPRTA